LKLPGALGRALASTLSALLCLWPALASHAAGCGSVGKIAADPWQEYEQQTKAAGCYVDWAPSSIERYAQCVREYGKLPLQIGEEMIGFWNAMAKNEWSTLGPRRIEFGGNKGTLVAPGNRMWLTATPAFMERSRSGSASAAGIR